MKKILLFLFLLVLFVSFVYAGHPHTWVYSVERDKIYARCSFDACIYHQRPIRLGFGVGNAEQLYATIRPDSASNKELLWTTSDSTVAKVDSEGRVEALKAGTARIRAISTDDSGRASFFVKVTVSDPENEIPHVHSYENCNYQIKGSLGHCRICNTCGNTEEIQEHNFVQKSDLDYHWDECSVCGYYADKFSHDYGDDDVCDTCSYIKTNGGGVSVYEVNYEPVCTLSGPVRSGNSFTYTLTSQKTHEKAQPVAIVWEVFYIDDYFEEHTLVSETSNAYTFTFTADKSSADYSFYRSRYLYVICAYSNEYGTSSESNGIKGWEI